MAKDPTLPILTALEARLRNNASGVPTAMGGTTRYYPRVPENRLFPYIALGPVTVDFEDETDCDSGSETFVQLDLYSRHTKPDEIAALVSAVVEALRPDLVLTGHATVDQGVGGARYLDDPDGLSRHAVLTLRLDTEPL